MKAEHVIDTKSKRLADDSEIIIAILRTFPIHKSSFENASQLTIILD